MRASTSAQVVGCPCQVGPRRRVPSYSDSSDAWPVAQVPPPNSGESGLPSILIGRPSRCLTNSAQAEEQPPQVVANCRATPGTISGVATGSGMAFCTGARQPAVRPTAPSENPIAARKSRRDGSAASRSSGSPPPPSRGPRPICTRAASATRRAFSPVQDPSPSGWW